jgi:hypothetical protein
MIKDPSALSALEVEAFDKVFDGNMISSQAKAIEMQGHFLGRTAASVMVVSFYIILKKIVRWFNYGCVR